jgi:hypothetical protein
MSTFLTRFRDKTRELSGKFWTFTMSGSRKANTLFALVFGSAIGGFFAVMNLFPGRLHPDRDIPTFTEIVHRGGIGLLVGFGITLVGLGIEQVFQRVKKSRAPHE